jgi:hypothetical protein
MGEAKRRRSSTQKFIEQNPSCCFCGGLRGAATREHMPPKSLFDNSHRPDKLVMPACDECNRGTSTADLAVAMISRWNYHSHAQERTDHTKLAAQIKKQAPELVAEWMKLDTDDRAKARRHLLKHGVDVPPDAGIATLGPLSIYQLNLFAHNKPRSSRGSTRLSRNWDNSFSRRHLRQLLQQRLRLLQIERVEALREPPVHRSEQFASLLHLALVTPEAGEACRSAEFPGFCLLLACRERTMKTCFGIGCFAQSDRHFTGHALDFGFAPPFPSTFDQGYCFGDTTLGLTAIVIFKVSPAHPGREVWYKDRCARSP